MEQVSSGQQQRKPDPKGRVDGGTEQVVKTGPLKAKKSELVRLHALKEEAGISYREAVAEIAKECGLQASVVKKYINHAAKEKLPELQREQEQMALVFFELA